MNKLTKIIGILSIILFITPMTVGLLFGEENKEIVDCYDRYENKIIGQECMDESFTIFGFSWGIILQPFAFLSACLFILFILLLLGNKSDYSEAEIHPRDKEKKE